MLSIVYRESFFILNEDGQVISVNNRFREHLDFNQNEYRHFTDYVSDKDIANSIESFHKTFENNENEVELYLKHKDGMNVPYMLSGVSTKIRNQHFLIGTGFDISSRIETERELVDEKAFTDKALNSLPGLFYVLDENGKYLRVNDAFIDLLEYSWDEIQTMNPSDFYLEEDFKKISTAIEKAFTEGYASITSRIKTKSGKFLHFYLTGSFIKANGKNYILGTGIDITKQHKLEDLLQQAQEMASIGAWEYDLHHGKIEWTQITRAIHEVDNQFVPTIDNALSFYVDKSRQELTKAIEKAKETGVSYDLELQIKTSKEKPKWVRTIGKPTMVDGKCIRLNGSFQDITRNKIYEERIESSLREKEILLEEIHHRVKNNLAIISSLMQLQAYQTKNKHVFKYLNDNQSRIQSIALIHEQLYQSTNFSSIKIHKQTSKLINHISKTFASDKDIKAELTLDSIELNINQAVPLSLLINEIVTNSYKHAFKSRKKGTIKVELSKEKDQINLCVSDDGVGIGHDINMESPSSLGMTLISTLKDQLKGNLYVNSESGTRFCLQFQKNDHLKGSSSNTILDSAN